MTDANAAAFELAALFGKPVLFSEVRIDPDTVPVGLYAYELRHAFDDISRPIALEEHIANDFYGTVISQSPIELTVRKYSCEVYDAKYRPVEADDFALDDFGSLTLEQYVKGEYELTPQPEKEIRVVVVEPMKKPYEAVVPNKLEAYQKLVGGYIETVYPFEKDNVILVCNEEGKVNGLPLNRRIEHDIIAGTFFLCGDNRAGDFASLTEDQVKDYIGRFSAIELYSGAHAPEPKPKRKADLAR